jgi:protein TonB
MQMRVLQRMLIGSTLAGCCAIGQGQSGGDGSVIIHSGDGSASSNDDGAVKVSAGVMAGQVLSKPDPVYPLTAKRAGISGAVVLAVRIDKNGRVARATAISGPEPLRDSALAAVRRWTYKPFLLNGAPQTVASTVTVNFYPGR